MLSTKFIDISVSLRVSLSGQPSQGLEDGQSPREFGRATRQGKLWELGMFLKLLWVNMF